MPSKSLSPSFPPPPREGVDWSEQSADTFVHAHVESRWCSKSGAWSEPALVEDPYLRVHGLAPVFHYGQEAYEGLKAFRTPHNEIQIARPDYHARRFCQSAELVSIPPVPQDVFLRSVERAVAQNADFVPPNDEDSMLYIRPVVFGTGGSMKLKPSDEYLFCVYVTSAPAFYGSESLDCLVLDDFDRAAPRGTGSGKVGGNYAPVMRWSQRAKDRGFDITLHLDSQTRTQVEEFSTSAFLAVRVQDGKPTLVSPDTNNVVDSVTSDCARQIAADLGWALERRPVLFSELERFDEIVACGTAVALVGIKSITRESTNQVCRFDADQKGEMGPWTKILQQQLRDIHKGTSADRFGWMHKVTAPGK